MKNHLNWRNAGILAIAVIVIYATLWASNLLATKLGISKGYLLIDAASTVFSVLVAGAVSVIALKLVFKNTMGKDFGDEFDTGWRKMLPEDRTKWMIVSFLVLFIGAILTSTARGETKAGPLEVSSESIDHILKHEVGGRSYFERFLRHPTVPAPRTTASGCTFGFGYDVGHTSSSRIRADWEGILSPEEMRLVLSVQGEKGMDAYYATKAISDRVTVDWEEAKTVFEKSSLKTFGELTARVYELKAGQLDPTQNGLMVSMTFNRGGRLDESKRPDAWDQYMEKRWIKHNIATGKLERVPGNLEHMTRIWRGRKLAGLISRYYEAAVIWRSTLN